MPAFISLQIDDSGNRLEVKNMCEDHNHAVSKVILLQVLPSSPMRANEGPDQGNVD